MWPPCRLSGPSLTANESGTAEALGLRLFHETEALWVLRRSCAEAALGGGTMVTRNRVARVLGPLAPSAP
jgi:hypothetical protein